MPLPYSRIGGISEENLPAHMQKALRVVRDPDASVAEVRAALDLRWAPYAMLAAESLQQNPAYPLLVLEDASLGEEVERLLPNLGDADLLCLDAEGALDNATWDLRNLDPGSITEDEKHVVWILLENVAALDAFVEQFPKIQNKNKNIAEIWHWQREICSFLLGKGLAQSQDQIDDHIKDIKKDPDFLREAIGRARELGSED